MHRATEIWVRCVVLAAGAALPLLAGAASCKQPLYLTFDTGHMGVAELIADTLDRHGVKATFFLANEATQAVGGRPAGETLDPHWASFWKRLAAQGHDVTVLEKEAWVGGKARRVEAADGAVHLAVALKEFGIVVNVLRHGEGSFEFGRQRQTGRDWDSLESDDAYSSMAAQGEGGG